MEEQWQFDPARAGALHSELTKTIDQFLSRQPNTLKAEVVRNRGKIV